MIEMCVCVCVCLPLNVSKVRVNFVTVVLMHLCFLPKSVYGLFFRRQLMMLNAT